MLRLKKTQLGKGTYWLGQEQVCTEELQAVTGPGFKLHQRTQLPHFSSGLSLMLGLIFRLSVLFARWYLEVL